MRLVGSGLSCVRGQRQVFAGLTFSVAAGEALAVTGPNGAGKSSLLRILAGLLPAAEGQLVLEGAASDTPIAEEAHYLGHRDALKGALSVGENLRFWRDFLGGGPRPLEDCLATCGLAHAANLPAAFLSAGQRRRLSMARLLAVPRPLWLLDEPTAALDAQGQALVARLMTDHLAQGGIVVAATHLPLGIETRQLPIGSAAA
jgi:heme exporter protein A